MSGMEGFSRIDGFRGMSRFMGVNPSSPDRWCPVNPPNAYRHFTAATSAVTTTRWGQRNTRPQAGM
jgi:hypothetical protein